MKNYNKEKVLRWLEQNNKYSFSIGPYRVPRYIDMENSTWSSRSKLKLLHETRIWGSSEYITNRAPGEVAFVKSIRGTFRKFGLEEPVEQLVLPVSNKDLWKNLCPKSLIDQKGNLYQDRLFFVIDIFLTSGIAIELDYDSTHQCPEYDKIRDIYIEKEYGIKTKRILDYGTTIPGTINGERLILDMIEYQLSYMFGRFDIDYSKTYLRTFELDFYNEIKLIKNLPAKLWGQSSLICKKSMLEKLYKKLKIAPNLNKLEKFMEAVGVEFEYT